MDRAQASRELTGNMNRIIRNHLIKPSCSFQVSQIVATSMQNTLASSGNYLYQKKKKKPYREEKLDVAKT